VSVATANQIKALLQSHVSGDDERFITIVMQVAAHEARQGHTKLANELKQLVDEARARVSRERKNVFSIVQPKPELAAILEVSQPRTTLDQQLVESVKVFPPDGQNEDEHIGFITAEAVSRAEINRPELNRVFTLSWAIGHEAQKNGVQVTAGKPTPLSARVDQLAFGVEESNDWNLDDQKKRLMVAATGSTQENYAPAQYPAINHLSEIEDPAQSWMP
jgi:subtilase family protein